MIIVLADDITGAAEIAGVCLNHQVSVSMSINEVPKQEADVVIIVTDSRSLTERDAYEIHFNLVKAIQQKYAENLPLIFKKCDSVLRGYVLTELLPFRELLDFQLFLLQPTNPSGGRIIENGKYLINNKRISYTPFSKDPDFPAKFSSIKKMLQARNTISFNILRTRINPTLPFGDGVMIHDCKNLLQMKHILHNHDYDMAIGSSAFFEQWLMIHLEDNQGFKPVNKNQINKISTRRKLFVAGSIHQEVNKLETIFRSHELQVTYLPRKFLLPVIDQNDFEHWLSETTEHLVKDHIHWISLGNIQQIFDGSSGILKERLSLFASEMIKKGNYDEIIVLGGASAYHLIHLLQWTDLQPIEMLGPGIIRLKVQNQPQKFITIKPGSYPWPEKELTSYLGET